MSDDSLDAWAARQYRVSAENLLLSISCAQTKRRPGFGQQITALPGSVVASPVLADYDPEPDYFFHWFRDAAVVMDALRVLHLDAQLGASHIGRLSDFVNFSLRIPSREGPALLAAGAGWQAAVADDHRRFLRSNDDLKAAHGPTVQGESRVNPDGSLDISRWARPQFDGPALRLLSLDRWLEVPQLPADVRDATLTLLRADLRFVARHAQLVCFDIWEEERGRHYYTLRVCAAALEAGARHVAAAEARLLRRQAEEILDRLDEFWLQDAGFYRSRELAAEGRSAKELDYAVILSVLHSDAQLGDHSVQDPRMHATHERLETLFRGEYPLNQDPRRAPAMGRYANDLYFSGGPYFFSTLGAAEFCYRSAASAAQPDSLRARGDSFLETVRRYTPADGMLAEQFDREDGRPRSARHLAWSYAAFISCYAARGRLNGADQRA